MTGNRAFAFTLLALSVLAGAARADTPQAGTPFDPLLEPTDAQTGWRIVALAAVDPLVLGCQALGTPFCPVAPTWEVTDLFAGPLIPPGLERFCVYESDAGDPQAIVDLLAQGCLLRASRDSMSVSYMGGQEELEALVWQPLRKQFLRQAGEVAPELEPTGFRRARLAIVDTQPTDQLDEPGNSGHGYTLINMARDLLCPGALSSCGVSVTSTLGLSYVDFCRGCTDPNGGFMGTVSELARAVRSAVIDWVDAVDSGQEDSRLVINLSVAWDPIFGDLATPANTPVPVFAAYRALLDAACRGAVIVAAAGNPFAGPGELKGPLLPAGWETRPVPSLEVCGRLLEQIHPPDPADFPVAPAYRPLVYAAGAVGADDRPVASRPDGEPRMVAFGDHAVTDVQEGFVLVPSDTQTGTSVAALVTSAAAAAAAFHQPDFPPFKLMRLVYQSGKAVPRVPGFCFGGADPCPFAVRRVTVCAAAESACAQPGGACAAAQGPICTPAQPVPPDLPLDDIETLYQLQGVATVDRQELTLQTQPQECGADYVLWSLPPTPPENPCPQVQYYGIQATPWTDSQPSSQPCETCSTSFRSPGTLYIEVNDSFEGVLTDITVLCGDEAYRLPDPNPSLKALAKYRMTGIPEVCADDLALAYRVVTAANPEGTVSVTTPLLVIPPEPMAN